MRKTYKAETLSTRDQLKQMSKLLNLAESALREGTLLGGEQVTRSEAERTGLGRIALAMEPELEEDSTDATAQLKQDVAISMNKGGIPAPVGAVPSENNPAYMGTQDTSYLVKQPEQYGKMGQTLGMEIPAPVQPHSAAMTGKAMGIAPDGPDLRSIADPILIKLYTESEGGYPQAITGLVRTLNCDIMEADRILSARDLEVGIRRAMVDKLKERGFTESVAPEPWVAEAISQWVKK